MRLSPEPRGGDRVVVRSGRHSGKEATFIRWDVVHSGQVRIYSMVRLANSGKQVRVLEISWPQKDECGGPDGHRCCTCNDARCNGTGCPMPAPTYREALP